MPIDVGPNYIRVRVATVKDVARFRVKTLGKGIRALIAFRKEGGSTIQSFLFSKAKGWTVSKARAWIKSHGYSVSETFLVHQILIDPKTNELVLEESTYKEGLNVQKLSREEFRKMIKE